VRSRELLLDPRNSSCGFLPRPCGLLLILKTWGLLPKPCSLHPEKLREASKRPERPREDQTGPSRRREPQRKPGMFREQREPKRPQRQIVMEA